MKNLYKKNLIGWLLVAACMMTGNMCYAQDINIESTLNAMPSVYNAQENRPALNDRHTCSVIFELSDSYGDGWNGARLTVSFNDGTPLQELTMTTGSSKIDTIDIGNGVHVSLGWISGNWDSECSFTIHYEDGEQICQQLSLSSGWTYDFDCSCSAAMEDWNLLNSFTLTSGGQQGIATDGNYIYSCSWMSNPSGGYSFYKYNMQGTLIEGFNIAGASEIIDLAYDGQFFYGSNRSNYLYKMDFTNKTLVSTISTTCTSIWFCTYYPETDGFWVGQSNLRLINRNGQTIKTAPVAVGTMGIAYYKDANNIDHLYLFSQGENNDKSLVYDYNITTNTLETNPIFDFEVLPGYDITDNPEAGGAFIGNYNGKTAFFGNVQQNPNLVGIYEIGSASPVAGFATVVLTAGDVWGDGTGYQMLLDADANTYGSVIPTSGGLTQSGNAPDEVYAQFEYKIPVNADGAMNTQNIVFNSSVAIQIPAGVYDWCITNPSPGDRIWIASSNGNIGGRQNDYLFEPNKTYEFVVTLQGQNDAVNVTITENLSYGITASVNPANSGTVSGGGVYQQGSTCTLTATANSGYTFEKWTKDGVQVSSELIYSFIVLENASYIAHFTSTPVSYTITTVSDPVEGGTTSGDGTYNAYTPCTIVATPNPGYEFVKWTKGQGDISEEPVHTFIVTSNATYVAHFQPTASNSCMITASADPAEGGSVTGGGNYNQGEECTLTATSNNGYTFVNWTKNGSVVSEEQCFSFTVTENASYVAHFMHSVGGYTISVSANPIEGGTVTGSGIYASGITITLTATANEGYKFVNWTENGVIQWMTDQYEFVVDRDRTLVANFEELPVFTISAMASANGTITPQGDVQVIQGADQTFTMIPNFGGRITKVLVDGIDIGSVESYTFTNVNRDHTIYVSFSGMGVEESQAMNVNVYPNPAKGMVYVDGEGIETVALYDMHGNCLRSMDYNLGKELNVSGLSQGTYILRLTTQDGRIGYKKLMVTD